MWSWDSIVTMVAGAGIAGKHRRHQWEQDVERAERTLERRAAMSRFLSMRPDFTDPTRSDGPTEAANTTFPPRRGLTPDRGIWRETKYVRPPGSVRPRLIHIFHRHPPLDEYPPKRVSGTANVCGVATIVTSRDSSDVTASPRDQHDVISAKAQGKRPQRDDLTAKQQNSQNSDSTSERGTNRQLLERVSASDCSALSAIPQDQDVISAGKQGMRLDGQDPTATQHNPQTDNVTSEQGADDHLQDQLAKQQAIAVKWVGLGRFQHVSTAKPEWIREKLQNEISGPGAYNSFDDQGLAIAHPLEKALVSRRNALNPNGVGENGMVADPSAYENVQTRLDRMFRTVPSTTVTADGCIVQKGFVIPRRPVTPKSKVSDRSTSLPGEHPQEQVFTDHASTGAAAPVVLPQQQPGKKPARRITWDEQSISGFHKNATNQVNAEIASAPDAPPEPQFGVAPPRRQRSGKRSIYTELPYQRVEQSAQASAIATHDFCPSQKETDTNVELVPAEEAEDAIASEADESDTPEAPLEPSKRVSPSLRSILGQSSSARADSTDSNASTLSARLGSMHLGRTEEMQATGCGQQVSARGGMRKRGVHPAPRRGRGRPFVRRM